MNERDWLACGDPHAMISFLEGKVNDRKLRLFACACCRRYWMFLDNNARKAVEMAERIADGKVLWEDIWEDISEVVRRTKDAFFMNLGDTRALESHPDRHVAMAVIEIAGIQAARETLHATSLLARQNISFADAPSFDSGQAEIEGLREARWDECELLRHIVGNPFRPVVIDPAWLRWNDGTVVKMAQALYDENRFDDLPFLADALQDAGCTNEEILSHCRTPMEHPRGCWLVDALLQKV